MLPAYRWLLHVKHYSADHIIVGGESIGAAMALILTLMIFDEMQHIKHSDDSANVLPMASCLILSSRWSYDGYAAHLCLLQSLLLLPLPAYSMFHRVAYHTCTRITHILHYTLYCMIWIFPYHSSKVCICMKQSVYGCNNPLGCHTDVLHYVRMYDVIQSYNV